jgi:hypothetical protein
VHLCFWLLSFLCGATTVEYGPLPQRIQVFGYQAPMAEYWKGYYSHDFRVDPETLTFVHSGRHFLNPSRFGIAGLPSAPDETNRRSHLDEKCNQAEPPTEQQRLAWSLLVKHAEALPNGAVTWRYDFALNYLNMVFQPGFNSAFAQAINIEALLFAECKTKEQRYLDLALKATDGLVTPILEGGLLNTEKGMTFFEEMPAPPELAPHILNADLLSVNVLYAVSKWAPRFKPYADRGAKTLERMLPLYEDGTCIRYDLKEPRRCTVSYVAYNAMLLDDLSEWTGNDTFKNTAARWRAPTKPD